MDFANKMKRKIRISQGKDEPFTRPEDTEKPKLDDKTMKQSGVYNQDELDEMNQAGKNYYKQKEEARKKYLQSLAKKK